MPIKLTKKEIENRCKSYGFDVTSVQYNSSQPSKSLVNYLCKNCKKEFKVKYKEAKYRKLKICKHCQNNSYKRKDADLIIKQLGGTLLSNYTTSDGIVKVRCDNCNDIVNKRFNDIKSNKTLYCLCQRKSTHLTEKIICKNLKDKFSCEFKVCKLNGKYSNIQYHCPRCNKLCKYTYNTIYNKKQIICNKCIKLEQKNKTEKEFKRFLIKNGCYPLERYKSDKTPIKIKCKCGKKYKKCRNHILQYSIYCSSCNKTSSSVENDICSFLEEKKISFSKNNRTIINPKEIDIVLNDYKIGIECNGVYWHTEKYGKFKNYHLDKLQSCNNANYSLLQFNDTDIINKFDIIKDIILSKTNNLKKRIYARKCDIREISYIEAKNFINNNHISGYTKSSVKIGLFYKNNMVGCMTFAKPRFNKSFEYEIIRLCFSQNTSVIGGASKLLSFFVNKYNPSNIISYADRRYSDGNVYHNLDMKLIGISEPSYIYTNGSNILSRYQCQKSKLKKILTNYDVLLTEKENMEKESYYRMWDCGNLIYGWSK